MEWRGRRQSTNIEDRRGQRTGGAGFGRMRIPFNIPSGGGLGRATGGGIGILVIAVVAMLIFGINPGDLFNGGGTSSQITGGQLGQTAPGQLGTPADEGGQFVATVLADTEDTWSEIFREAGEQYPPPTLVLFDGQTQSVCGFASAATGPFYCPADRKLYIDLAFYDELRTEFGAPGDFAQAYVIAHEVGHHIQNLLGTLDETDAQRRRASEVQANQISVRVELQADCYAGVWAARTEARLPFLQPGDIEEALNAAAKIGDDAIQRRTQGYVVPDSFNHGSSAQRATWFRRGFTEGTPQACDTFTGPI